MYGTQAARKIESFNLKMRLEKMLVYSLAVLLLPLAGEKPTQYVWPLFDRKMIGKVCVCAAEP